MRNAALQKLEYGSTDTDFSRSLVTYDKKCPKCKGEMLASYFDREAIFEQLEEFQCQSCQYVEPKTVGYPRMMERALTKKEGEKHYKEHCVYNKEGVTKYPPEWLEKLTHMLGAGKEVKKSCHGYRNRFCAAIGGDDYKIMKLMEKAGLVTVGSEINYRTSNNTAQFFHATLEGCKAIGLSKAAIKRAFED